MSLGLHRTTHKSKANQGLAILSDKCRYNRMERSFMGFVHIGMAFFKTKKFTSILQHKPKTFRYNARAHAPIVTLDERHHISFAISSGEVDRIALLQFTGGVGAGGAVALDESTALSCILFTDQLLNRVIIDVRICVKLRPILKREFLGFCEMMDIVS